MVQGSSPFYTKIYKTFKSLYNKDSSIDSAQLGESQIGINASQDKKTHSFKQILKNLFRTFLAFLFIDLIGWIFLSEIDWISEPIHYIFGQNRQHSSILIRVILFIVSLLLYSAIFVGLIELVKYFFPLYSKSL